LVSENPLQISGKLSAYLQFVSAGGAKPSTVDEGFSCATKPPWVVKIEAAATSAEIGIPFHVTAFTSSGAMTVS
jgi:hypothetical protein